MVEPTHLKNMMVKLDHLPRYRGENKKVFENTTQEIIEEGKGETLNHVGHDTNNRSHNESTIRLGTVRLWQSVVSRKNASAE